MENWKYISYKNPFKVETKNLQLILNELPKPIVFTNGVFDILHIGHVKYLINSKSLGSSLVVGINSNSSSKLLDKGIDRPINDEIERASVILSLKPVDLCIVFNQLTPENLIKDIKPNIYTKGQDYDKSKVPFISTLEHMNIKTYFLPLVSGKSTTLIIKTLKK